MVLHIKDLILFGQENGRLAEYGLASEGVSQAQLAGELLLKVQLVFQ